MNVGRNDPCLCGSGRKYKKCCLLAKEPAGALPELADDRPHVRAAVMKALLRFAERPEFQEAGNAALRLFLGVRREGLDDEETVADERFKFAFFHAFDYALDGGRTLAETFLERSGYQLGSRQERLLRRLAAARLRPYEVEEVRVDEGLQVRDLWSQQQIFVTERSGHQLTRWDLLVARVAPEEDGTQRVEGGIYLFPTRLKQALLDALKKEERRLRRRQPRLGEDGFFKRCAPLIHHFWLDHVVFPPMPTLVTAEHDPMVFGKVVFEVIDRAALHAALDGHPELESDDEGGYTWVEEADNGFTRSLGHIALEDDRLVLEVTSRKRAERGRRLIERAAEGALRHRATRYESVPQALKRQRTKAPREAPEVVPPEIAAPFIREYKERHYKTWPDEPLPALDGRTAREAARLKTLRPRLVDLLKEMENMETRAARPENPAYDFGWMWTELGLERPT